MHQWDEFFFPPSQCLQFVILKVKISISNSTEAQNSQQRHSTDRTDMKLEQK